MLLVTLLFGFLVAGLVTYLAQTFGYETTKLHWMLNLLLGGLGALAGNQLLNNTFQNSSMTLSLLAMVLGSMVLTVVSSWTVDKRMR